MQRRSFVKNAAFAALASNLFIQTKAAESTHQSIVSKRDYWLSVLDKIALPVLESLANNELRKHMPFNTLPNAYPNRDKVCYLEAFARTLNGIAPWIEHGQGSPHELELQSKYRKLARKSLANAVDPQSADFMNFTAFNQPLVDAAFLAQALLRAPIELWDKLEKASKNNVIEALKSTRHIVPYDNNWVLFSAMIEAALLRFNGDGDIVKMDLILRIVENWYKGDGMYSDGADFHLDYYNSIVIQPFLLDILEELIKIDRAKYYLSYEKVKKIAVRHARQLELLISPEGYYPPIGRSITYRFGIFHLLAQVTLRQELPAIIHPTQVRESLSAVIEKTMQATNMFDSNGWLQIGVFGHQPSLAEPYINTGSLYLCSTIFLPLGLPSDNVFWSGDSRDWTSKKIWNGVDVLADSSLKEK